MMEIRQCRWCGGKEHSSGTMCGQHPDFRPIEPALLPVEQMAAYAITDDAPVSSQAPVPQPSPEKVIWDSHDAWEEGQKHDQIVSTADYAEWLLTSLREHYDIIPRAAQPSGDSTQPEKC